MPKPFSGSSLMITIFMMIIIRHCTCNKVRTFRSHNHRRFQNYFQTGDRWGMKLARPAICLRQRSTSLAVLFFLMGLQIIVKMRAPVAPSFWGFNVVVFPWKPASYASLPHTVSYWQCWAPWGEGDTRKLLLVGKFIAFPKCNWQCAFIRNASLDVGVPVLSYGTMSCSLF
jgi:hypothetical protein